MRVISGSYGMSLDPSVPDGGDCEGVASTTNYRSTTSALYASSTVGP